MTDPDIAAFTADLGKFIAAVDIEADKAIRKIAFDLFSSIVKKTPVDTGRARGAWEVGLDRSSTKRAKKGKTSVVGKQADALRKLSQFKIGQSIFITNNVDYIVFLEMGTSTQAPRGMVKLSIGEIRAAFRGVR